MHPRSSPTRTHLPAGPHSESRLHECKHVFALSLPGAAQTKPDAHGSSASQADTHSKNTRSRSRIVTHISVFGHPECSQLSPTCIAQYDRAPTVTQRSPLLQVDASQRCAQKVPLPSLRHLPPSGHDEPSLRTAQTRRHTELTQRRPPAQRRVRSELRRSHSPFSRCSPSSTHRLTPSTIKQAASGPQSPSARQSPDRHLPGRELDETTRGRMHIKPMAQSRSSMQRLPVSCSDREPASGDELWPPTDCLRATRVSRGALVVPALAGAATVLNGGGGALSRVRPQIHAVATSTPHRRSSVFLRTKSSRPLFALPPNQMVDLAVYRVDRHECAARRVAGGVNRDLRIDHQVLTLATS
jgi:hypothetical protein